MAERDFWPCPECFFGLSNQGRERKTEKAPRDCTRGEGMQLLWDLALFFLLWVLSGQSHLPWIHFHREETEQECSM